MLEWLKSFADILEIFVNFVISFVQDAILFVTLSVKGLIYMRQVFTYLPVQYQVAISLVATFSLVLTVIHLGAD